MTHATRRGQVDQERVSGGAATGHVRASLPYPNPITGHAHSGGGAPGAGRPGTRNWRCRARARTRGPCRRPPGSCGAFCPRPPRRAPRAAAAQARGRAPRALPALRRRSSADILDTSSMREAPARRGTDCGAVPRNPQRGTVSRHRGRSAEAEPAARAMVRRQNARQGATPFRQQALEQPTLHLCTRSAHRSGPSPRPARRWRPPSPRARWRAAPAAAPRRWRTRPWPPRPCACCAPWRPPAARRRQWAGQTSGLKPVMRAGGGARRGLRCRQPRRAPGTQRSYARHRPAAAVQPAEV